MRRFALVAAILTITAPIFAASVGKPTDVQLTIYNQNFALVKEDRDLVVEKGLNQVAVQDVASSIEPTSVAFKSLSSPNSISIREQNYQFDLVNVSTILDKSIGKKVRVTRYLDGKTEVSEGTLLSSAQNGIVIKTESGLILNPSGEIEVMELPEGLVSRSTLMWKLEAAEAGPQHAELSYLANDMTWSANYVAVVDASDKYVDLTGWVTLTNNSGVTYNNAALNLMAGDVHLAPKPMPMLYARAGVADMASAAGGPAFTEKSFFEYHLYTLQGKTTVRNRETKQITLLTADSVPAKKIYVYDGRKDWWSEWQYGGYQPGESYEVSANKKVTVTMEIVNKKENNLGIPLPKGNMRVYKAEDNGSQQFIGEDSIDHTPRDEKVRLNLGDAFDIVGEHKRTNFKRINNRTVEETFQISLRNHKDQQVNVLDVEHLTGDWTITESSDKYFKKDASTVQIPVDVPANGEKVITYTVRTKW
jgi:hypothetical protein